MPYRTMTFLLKFRTPSGLAVCGPTMSGKSQLISSLIYNEEHMFGKQFDRIVYCCGEWQQAFIIFKERCNKVEFVKRLGEILENEDYFDGQRPYLLIMDD